nr:hypothetical protein [Pseudonocardia thermophila]
MGERGVVGGAGDAEVDEVREVAVRTGEHHDGRLHVAVDEAFGVRSVEGLGDLSDDVDGAAPGAGPA